MPKREKEDPGTLMQRTIEMLDELPNGESLPEFAARLGISYYWLRKFKSGEIPNPSVNKVQHLYEELTGKSLIPKTVATDEVSGITAIAS